jgi:uncharacterized protein (DUF1778 family)
MTVRKAQPAPRRSVRMTEAQWRLIQAAAAAAETHPSSYLRQVALEAARRDLATTS